MSKTTEQFSDLAENKPTAVQLPAVTLGSTELDFGAKAKNTIALINDSFKGLSTVDEAVSTINTFADMGREHWVKISLLLFKVTNNLTAKDKKAKFEALATKLKYQKSQMYDFIKAGKKLVSGEFTYIPTTHKEFLKGTPKLQEGYHIFNIYVVGSYWLKDKPKMFIYQGSKAVHIDDTETKLISFKSTEQPEVLVGSKLQAQTSVRTNEKGEVTGTDTLFINLDRTNSDDEDALVDLTLMVL